MNASLISTSGGFAYLPGGPHPFSNGVVALQRYAFTRVRLRYALPLEHGLALAGGLLRSANRPPAALAACELRSPAPMSLAEFARFNAEYVRLLGMNGFGAEATYPIARSNLAPQFDAPTTAMLFAFTYTVPLTAYASNEPCDFVVSGLPERPDTPAGLQGKAAQVIAMLRERVDALGGEWGDVTGVNVYTVAQLDGFIGALKAHDLFASGLSLYPSYPPVVGLEFEADVRAVRTELVV